jgi:hypothetical protein
MNYTYVYMHNEKRDAIVYSLPIFLFHGATAPSGPGPPHYRVSTITLRHTTLCKIIFDE